MTLGLTGPMVYKLITWPEESKYHHTYEIEPLNKKGLLKIRDKYSNWVISPYAIGDTINVTEQGSIWEFESHLGFTDKYVIKSIKTEEY